VTTAARARNIACMMPSMSDKLVSIHLGMGFTMVQSSNDATVMTTGLRQGLNSGAEAVKEWKEKQAEGKNGSK